MLKQLGIDEAKEGEVYDYGADGSFRRYDGWFYLSGGLIQPGEQMTDAVPDFSSISLMPAICRSHRWILETVSWQLSSRE